MGSFSLAHWIIVALVVLVLFGRGKISETMGDFGKGVKSFRKGLADDDAPRPAADPAARPAPGADSSFRRAFIGSRKAMNCPAYLPATGRTGGAWAGDLLCIGVRAGEVLRSSHSPVALHRLA